MVVSDNGASAEGGPHGSVNENLFFNNVPETLEDNLEAIDDLGGPKYFNHYPWGWAWAGNTPFRRWKRETYRGGAADPFIVHWPTRHQGARARCATSTRTSSTWCRRCWTRSASTPPAPSAASRSHRSRACRSRTRSPTPRPQTRHHTQYFEMMGHRAIYHDGWRAVCPVPGPSFTEAGMGFGEMVITEDKLRELDAKGWELYHVAEDFSETKNLAAEHRDKLIEMIALWYVEAGKYDVLPIDARGTARLVEERPQLAPPRNLYVYYPRTSVVSNKIAPRMLNRPHSITATVEIANGAEGVLVAQGGSSGGYALYLKDHKLHYAYNFLGVQQFHLATDATVGDGRHELRFEFEPTGQARPRARQGDAGARAALHRRQAGRPGRPAGHHPARHRHHRGAVLRPRRGLGGDDRLPGAVRVHRPAREDRGRRVGRADRGQGRRDALGDGAPVAAPGLSKLEEREGFEPSIQLLGRIAV